MFSCHLDVYYILIFVTWIAIENILNKFTQQCKLNVIDIKMMFHQLISAQCPFNEHQKNMEFIK